jgi:hypothetical protein
MTERFTAGFHAGFGIAPAFVREIFGLTAMALAATRGDERYEPPARMRAGGPRTKVLSR